jgi:hypothetical protein
MAAKQEVQWLQPKKWLREPGYGSGIAKKIRL